MQISFNNNLTFTQKRNPHKAHQRRKKLQLGKLFKSTLPVQNLTNNQLRWLQEKSRKEKEKNERFLAWKKEKAEIKRAREEVDHEEQERLSGKEQGWELRLVAVSPPRHVRSGAPELLLTLDRSSSPKKGSPPASPDTRK